MSMVKMTKLMYDFWPSNFLTTCHVSSWYLNFFSSTRPVLSQRKKHCPSGPDLDTIFIKCVEYISIYLYSERQSFTLDPDKVWWASPSGAICVGTKFTAVAGLGFQFSSSNIYYFLLRKYKRKRNMGNGHQLELQLHYSKQRKLITTVHGIFLLLLTLDLGGLPSNLLSSPPSTASPSSLSYEHEQPLLPGER